MRRAIGSLFGDIPTATGRPTGTTLGGAGIAISTACANPEAAIAYATWITERRGADRAVRLGRRPAWPPRGVARRRRERQQRRLLPANAADDGTAPGSGPGSAATRSSRRTRRRWSQDCVVGRSTVAATLDDLDELWRSVVRRPRRVGAAPRTAGALHQRTGSSRSTREFGLSRSHRGCAVELEVRHPLRQRRERDLALGTRQRRADAEMRSKPERDMAVRLPPDVEGVRSIEHGRVAVRAAEHLEGDVAFLEPATTQLGVPPEKPGLTRDRAFEPQDLLDGPGDERRDRRSWHPIGLGAASGSAHRCREATWWSRGPRPGT